MNARSNHFVTGAMESRQPGYDFFATTPAKSAPEGQGAARHAEAEWGGHKNDSKAAAEFIAKGGRF